MFKSEKTKWEPILIYNAVATNSVKIVYARYDFKTGLYDFKTQTVARDIYTTQMGDLVLPIRAHEVLNKLRKKQ